MYERFYGLNEKPFNVPPDQRFLFLGGHHQEALAHLIYGTNERKGFIVLTGEVGAGKTLLIRALLERLSMSTKTALIFNPNLTLKDLFCTILDEFGLNTQFETKADFLNILNSFLIECLHRNENAVLVIDEAQALSPSILEEIRLLLSLETSKEKLLQIILSGQPELNYKLELPQLRQLKQRISIRYHLPPLTKAETKDYIRKRISVAGSKDFSIFTDKAIDDIYNYAKGIPRLINILCDNSMLVGYATNQSKIGFKIIRECIQDLESNSTTRETTNKIIKVERKNPFIRTVWRLILVFVFLTIMMTGDPSLDVRHITNNSREEDKERKIISIIQTVQDTSEKVRKKINSPMENKLPLKGNSNNSLVPIQKRSVEEKDSSQVFEKGSPKTSYTITVVRNDTLIGIASRKYGWVSKEILDFIHRANPEIKDVNYIRAGQKIFLPALAKKQVSVKYER